MDVRVRSALGIHYAREDLELASPRDRNEVLAEMARHMVRWLSMDHAPGAGEFVVVGKLNDGDRIRLVGLRPWHGNSFRRVFRGALLPDTAGCRLAGTLRVSPAVRLISYGLVLFAAAWTVGLLGVACAAVIDGNGGRAFQAGGIGALGVAMLGFQRWLSGGASRDARAEEEYLKRWLAERMR